MWRDSYIENRGRERIDSTDETAMLASADGLRTVGNMSESETANLASTPGVCMCMRMCACAYVCMCVCVCVHVRARARARVCVCD